MPVTYKSISTVTVSTATAASMEFTNIPGTFDDLVLKISMRQNRNNTYDALTVAFNGSTASMTRRYVFADNATTGSGSASDSLFLYSAGNASTASTFTNNELYIYNYSGGTNKAVSSDNAIETNAAGGAVVVLLAGLWSNTAAITSITLTQASGSFLQYSTAYLYGIKKS